MSKGAENENPTEATAGGPDVQTILNAAAADPALSVQQEQAIETGQPAGALQVVDNAADATEILDFAHESLSPLYPRAAAIYTPELRQKIGTKIGALLDKYELNCGGLVKEWGAEISLAITVVPLISKTVQAVRQDNAEWEAQEAAQGKSKTEAETFGGQQEITNTPAPGSLYAKA